MRDVQKVLQDDLRGNRVEYGFAILPAFPASASKFGLGLGGAESFVDERDRDIETAMQLIGKASTAARGRVLDPVNACR